MVEEFKKIKILFTGDSKTGKSNIMDRYVNNNFTENTISTIGVDFSLKDKEYNNSYVKFQIWDTSGQERFKIIVNSYYKGCNAIIMVFDLSDKSSFENLKKTYDEIVSCTERTYQLFVVGNKLDLVKDNDSLRAVNSGVAKNFAESLSADYYEISAKSGENINELFNNILAKTA